MKRTKPDTALVMPTPAEIGGGGPDRQLWTLLVNSVNETYGAERALVAALPKMRDAASSELLRTAISEHLVETMQHVKRMEEVLRLCGEGVEGKSCRAMDVILEDGEELISGTEPGSMARDAAIILAAQKVEHFEIATYGGLTEFARNLGLKEVAGLLDATLDEEKLADSKLTLLARMGINWQAEHENVTASLSGY